MTNEEWLQLDVRVATPNPELPVVQTIMALCYCGEPCIAQVENGETSQYTHAISMKEECSTNPRNDPPT